MNRQPATFIVLLIAGFIVFMGCRMHSDTTRLYLSYSLYDNYFAALTALFSCQVQASDYRGQLATLEKIITLLENGQDSSPFTIDAKIDLGFTYAHKWYVHQELSEIDLANEAYEKAVKLLGKRFRREHLSPEALRGLILKLRGEGNVSRQKTVTLSP